MSQDEVQRQPPVQAGEEAGEGKGEGVAEDGTPLQSVAGTAALMKSVTKFIQGGQSQRSRASRSSSGRASPSQELLALDGEGSERGAAQSGRRGRRRGIGGGSGAGTSESRRRRMDYPADSLRGRPRGSSRGGAAIAGKTSPNLIEYFRKRTHFNKEEVDALCLIFCKLVETSQAHQSGGKVRGGGSSGSGSSGSSGGGGVGGDGGGNASASFGGGPIGASGSASLGNGVWMPTEGLDRVVFREVLHNTFDLVTEEVLMDRVFCAFDRRNDGVLRLDEWLLGLSVFVRGDASERTAFAFRVYDLNGDGVISRDEMFQLLRNCLMKQPNDEDPDEGVRDLVELSLKKLDRDRDGKVSFNDFQEAVNAEPLLLEAFGQCLPSEAACQSFMSTLLA